MSFMCFSSSCYVLSVIIAFCVVILTYFKWSYTYWKRRNLPSLTPTSWHGNMENPFFRKKSLGIWLKEIYNEFKNKGLKHGGIYSFTSPTYVPIDPDIIKNILQSDFQYFSDRGAYYNVKGDPLSGGLFFLGGQKWRNMRVKLTPTFTSGKIKMMFETLVECSKPLKSMMDELTEGNEKINIKDLVARYTTDIIGSCAFGLECNSFKSGTTEFRKFGKQIFDMSTFRLILQLICVSQPSLGEILNVRAFPKTATDFFLKVIEDTVNYRKENNIKRKDILQLLMEINSTSNNSKSEQNSPLTIEEIAAQCLGFFLAGYETSSSTMSFCLYELAKNPEIQQKVRDEIHAILLKYDGQITYDFISELDFMTLVIEETLRKYPSLPVLPRKCIKDYPVPNTNVIIEKGTSVLISIYGLHHDPDYFENPDTFDPERFSEKKKKGRHQFTYIPFGEGPRLCIGLRFGMMQIKVGLTVLLKNYKFTLNRNTPNVLSYNINNMFVLDCGDEICLDSQKIHSSTFE